MAGELVDPHAVLGPHLVDGDGAAGVVIRAFHPDAAEVDYLPARGQPRAMTALGEGLFAVFLEGRKRPPRYRLRFRFDNGGEWERDDPYRFAGSISDDDLAAFADGEHPRLWEMLGHSGQVSDESWPGIPDAGSWRGLTAGAALGTPEALFPRLTDPASEA